jgi:Nuclear fragile X mental retardation-interacting protein 1 (NUFIP1)/Zinc finger C-x8-C-x5-C-x3-H type (and similar)
MRGGYAERGGRGRGVGHMQNAHGFGSQNSDAPGQAKWREYGSDRGYDGARGQGNFQRTSPPSFLRNNIAHNLNPAQKRHYGQAFPTARIQQKRPQAAPAVPSFNASIASILGSSPTPSKPGSLNDTNKPRKQNQLGLTPSLKEAESGSDDEDEESRLAQTVPGTGYQFEYRGRTSTLKSAADIVAWIAERRKNYPTQARADMAKKEAEERRLKWDAEKKAAQEAARVRREEREKHQREEKELRQRLLDARNAPAQSKSSQTHGTTAVDPAAKAFLKAEKLRKKAVKAQHQLAKAEEALRKAQALRSRVTDKSKEEENGVTVETVDGKHSLLVEEEPVSASSIVEEVDSSFSAAEIGSRPEITDPQVLGIPEPSFTNLKSQILTSDFDVSPDAADLSDSISDSESTSSSGTSDLFDSDSDDNSDSAPEESSSKAQGPMRVPPPKRDPLSTTGPSNVCRRLLKTGRCRFGDRCRYSHDLLSRQDVSRHSRKPAQVREQSRRKGLWEVMVEKEQEQEREQMLRAIIALGDHGMLECDDKIDTKSIV